MSGRSYNIAIALVSTAIIVVIAAPYAPAAIGRLTASLSRNTLTSAPRIILPEEEASHPESFDALYRAGRALAAATDVGATYVQFGDLLQKYATECDILADRTQDRLDRDVLERFLAALESYKAAKEVWRLKIKYADSRIRLTEEPSKALLMDNGVAIEGGVIKDPDLAIQTLRQSARVELEAGNARLRP